MNKTILFLLASLMFSALQLFSQDSRPKIMVLTKDRDTGIPFANDTLYASINDSTVYKVNTDAEGYCYFILAPGKYSVTKVILATRLRE